MKIQISTVILFLSVLHLQAQSFKDVRIEGKITSVQPMTGIVLWSDNSEYRSTDAISLEFSYVKYNDIVNKTKGVYDWSVMEKVLNDIASRKHQAIIRFYFVYPRDLPLRDGKTTVPEYIQQTAGYAQFDGDSEDGKCSFPDWRSTELQNFALEFYTELAKKYDNDPRLAFLQTGFGLWAEYHTWGASFRFENKTYKESGMLGVGFPSKDYQKTFLNHLNSVFVHTPWSISIDAADSDYTPMAAPTPNLRNLNFGLFDDSFMCKDADNWNKGNWDFFGSDRYKKSPCGGEFSYYTGDQEKVLSPGGLYGRTYEQQAVVHHISYMLGNNQPGILKDMNRIKQASMASGYKFKLVSFKTSSSGSKAVIKNIGVAPIYYDAYVSVNGTRAPESLKGLLPGEEKEYTISSGGNTPDFKIVCDRLVPGQSIQFEGNETGETNETKITHIITNRQATNKIVK